MIVLSKFGVNLDVKKIVVGLFVLLIMVIVDVFCSVNLKLGIKLSRIVLNKVVKILNCVVVFNSNICGFVIKVLKFVSVLIFMKIRSGNILELIFMWYI